MLIAQTYIYLEAQEERVLVLQDRGRPPWYQPARPDASKNMPVGQFDPACNKPYLFLKDSPWPEGLSIMSSQFISLSQSRHSQKDWHFTEVCTSRRSELVSSEQRARCLVEKVGSRLARPTNHQSRVGLVLQNILQHNTPLPTLPEITFWLLISWRERQKPPKN